MRHHQGCEDKHTEGINQQSNLRAAMVATAWEEKASRCGAPVKVQMLGLTA